jgi:putative FmdB family regulatory protein
MPIYEYKCRSCEHYFEELVRHGQTPDCPECGGRELEQLISLPAVSTEGSRQRNLSRARERAGKTHKEKQHAQAEYERNYYKDHGEG